MCDLRTVTNYTNTPILSSGPSLFMVLSRPDAVAGWRAMMGPTDPEKAKQEQPDRFDH